MAFSVAKLCFAFCLAFLAVDAWFPIRYIYPADTYTKPVSESLHTSTSALPVFASSDDLAWLLQGSMKTDLWDTLNNLSYAMETVVQTTKNNTQMIENQLWPVMREIDIDSGENDSIPGLGSALQQLSNQLLWQTIETESLLFSTRRRVSSLPTLTAYALEDLQKISHVEDQSPLDRLGEVYNAYLGKLSSWEGEKDTEGLADKYLQTRAHDVAVEAAIEHVQRILLRGNKLGMVGEQHRDQTDTNTNNAIAEQWFQDIQSQHQHLDQHNLPLSVADLADYAVTKLAQQVHVVENEVKGDFFWVLRQLERDINQTRDMLAYHQTQMTKAGDIRLNIESMQSLLTFFSSSVPHPDP